jgi:homeobox protein cut-like
MGAPADTVEEKYRPVYEETVNPFNAFHSQEKTKRIRELNPAERLIYQMSSFFLANKQTRMFLFGYAVILHFMVFLTTYKLAHSSCDVDGNGA